MIMTPRAVRKLIALVILLIFAMISFAPTTSFAAPPYITDDPEPTDYRHWEVYLASQFAEQPDNWTSTAPHLELDYGALPNVQLELIAPMVLYAPTQGPSSYGYGDTQLGIKFRFL